MRKRSLTEVQAWREIARQFAEPEAHRASAGTGLCWAVKALYDTYQITSETNSDMHARIDDHMRASGGGILDEFGNGPWAFEPSDDDAKSVRVLAALFLALEAKDEAALDEFCEACGEVHA